MDVDGTVCKFKSQNTSLYSSYSVSVSKLGVPIGDVPGEPANPQEPC